MTELDRRPRLYKCSCVGGYNVDRSERFVKIQQIARSKGFVTIKALVDALAVSPATAKRDIEYLRDRMHCPISWDPKTRGYVIKTDGVEGGRRHELPGLWFNASEIHALLAVQHLLKGLQPGLLDDHIRPLQSLLRDILGAGPHSVEAIERRVKLIQLGMRRVELKHFEQVSQAVLDRRRLQIEYLTRDRMEVTSREISPLQLVHYRENWLLDAWCHWRGGIRTFSLDAIQAVSTTTIAADDVSPEELAKHFESGYGIYSGQAIHRAKLKFTAARAQWVSRETWHSDQTTRYLEDGSYLLEVPYSSDQELVMDLLRHGTDVEVLEPPALRKKVATILAQAAQKYS
jgi:predicted DNA-binding transcriptional regulator YafY